MRRWIAYAMCVLAGAVLGITIQTATAVTDPGISALEKKVVELDKRLDALETVIKISGSTVNIEANDINLKASGDLRLKGARITQN